MHYADEKSALGKKKKKEVMVKWVTGDREKQKWTKNTDKVG